MAGKRESPIDALRAALSDREFGSDAEAEEFLSAFLRRQNEAPLAEFHGLSPNDMHRFLHEPFTSPGLLTLTDPLPAAPQAPISLLFMQLAEALADGPVKLTAKGNLPRALSRNIHGFAKTRGILPGYAPLLLSGSISSEEDYLPLHLTHIMAKLAGLARKTHGRLHLTKKAEKRLHDHGEAGIYPLLFRAYCQKFNWSYPDRWPEFHIVQRAWAFSLYLLTRYGHRTRPATYYAESFLRAFPAVLAEAPEDSWHSPAEAVTAAYSLRTFRNFAALFGLIEEPADPEAALLPGTRPISARPLLKQVISFRTAD